MSFSDKQTERIRYDQRALSYISTPSVSKLVLGSSSVPPLLRTPYIKYEQHLLNLLPSSGDLLELSAGMGEHTSPLISSGCNIIAADISSNSHPDLRSRFAAASSLKTVICDIEDLSYPDQSLDVLACAGGLSYGDNLLVLQEIYRVLTPGGYFICVDSLSHNPIYRANRLVRYLLGQRTLSTLKRMLTISLIKRYQSLFKDASCQYFGKFSWLMLPISILIGETTASKLSSFLDRVVTIEWLAFKFVLVARTGIYQ